MVKIKRPSVVRPTYDSFSATRILPFQKPPEKFKLIRPNADRFSNASRQPDKLDRSLMERIKVVIVNCLLRSLNINSALSDLNAFFDVLGDFLVRWVVIT